MRISLPKLKAIILYFCAYTNSRFLGKVKLMKLFYFLDFMHVKNHGVPVTYDCYVNLEHGPVPSTIKNLVDTVESDVDNAILADTIQIDKSDGENIHRVKCVRKFTEKDEEYLSENEIKILKKICVRFADSNMVEIEKISHEEAPWKETKALDEIPYTLAAKDSDCLVDEETIRIMLKAE